MMGLYLHGLAMSIVQHFPDIDRGVVTLADPTYGIVERSMEEFVTYYQKYYYQAVVVR